MAYFRQNSGKWRAEIERYGVRKSRTFARKEDAEAWAASTEARVKKRQEQKLVLADATLLRSLPTRFLNAIRETAFDTEEILGAAVRCGTQCGVYFLILNETIIYVGQSTGVLHRIARHRRDGRAFDSYAYIECPRDKLDETEAAYIVALMPEMNLALGAFARRKLVNSAVPDPAFGS